ncbi:DVU_1555 family C-GCAxxG-C-C protein [Sporomusa acidovorans]|uniref:Redox-active protein n=1 Tax=Sporomusa acidovorans (strain ATCC 49682 / DSM 3132 / Mol) TaxID=1123286 RepID=A0ABZ3J036_SPOA4|nr:DV_1555 family C-GCAxxG-C-C protein [Sporomusa acidovorans]OZC21320.1 putative redox-active protein [Sporomusa acidovorans DSM 3132]SDE57429.1 Putative redox-active protein (C_GCAxxG_C_C) [Sporomusa acidovorans]
MADNSRLFALKLQGYCCSQIVLKLGLEDAQLEDNPQLIQAVAGLCDGLHSDMVCGIFSATACLISLLQPRYSPVLINDLAEWFASEFEESNGGIACKDILGGNQLNRSTKCPKILAATYDKAVDLLEVSGYEFPARE